jgi:hypothetical protein
MRKCTETPNIFLAAPYLYVRRRYGNDWCPLYARTKCTGSIIVIGYLLELAVGMVAGTARRAPVHSHCPYYLYSEPFMVLLYTLQESQDPQRIHLL